MSDDRLPIAHAAALGAIQGPAELLPVSSSGHLVLVPAMLGWPYRELDPEIRKSVEVALHAGGALALLIGLRKEVREYLRSFGLHNLASLTLSFMPAALIALRFERPIERRLSEPYPVAIALIAGSVAMAIADGRPERRAREQASLMDAIVIGAAQAFALAPGVSRNGATLTAARWRGFRRADANVISRQIALPVIVGASVLKGARLARREFPPGVGTRHGGRRRGGLLLDARLDAADRDARAQPLAPALRRLSERARRRRAVRPSQACRARREVPHRSTATVRPPRLRTRPLTGARRHSIAACPARGTHTRRPASTRRRLGTLSTRWWRCSRRSTRAGRAARSWAPGHYASVLALDERTGIALCTDGVGTKLIVAEQAGRFDTVGIDCVAMNVNDLICVGAEPRAMVDYLAVEQADADVLAAIGARPKAGAEEARIEIPGGELAQLPEMVRGHPSPSGLDLVGAAIGIVPLDRVVTGERIAPGDAVIGLPSTGLHSNGFTLARRALLERGRPAARRIARRSSDARWPTSCSSRPRSMCGRSSSCCAPRSTCAASPTSPATGC